MKRVWIYFIAVVLVAAAVAGGLIARENSQDHTDKTKTSSQANSSSQPFKAKPACTIFTLADAKQVLGAGAKGGDNASTSSSKDLSVSLCNYSQDAGSNVPVSASKSASLLVRAPNTGAGITSNQNQFGYLKPADSQPVSGYGDTAYWDPQYGQLDILKHNTWYILSNGPITPSARTLGPSQTAGRYSD